MTETVGDLEWIGTMEDICDEVISERQRRHDKFGDQSHIPRTMMLAVLMEEVGEVAEAIIEDFVNQQRHETPFDDPDARPLVPLGSWIPAVRAELIQVAAVAVQMIEHIDNEDV